MQWGDSEMHSEDSQCQSCLFLSAAWGSRVTQTGIGWWFGPGVRVAKYCRPLRHRGEPTRGPLSGPSFSAGLWRLTLASDLPRSREQH